MLYAKHKSRRLPLNLQAAPAGTTVLPASKDRWCTKRLASKPVSDQTATVTRQQRWRSVRNGPENTRAYLLFCLLPGCKQAEQPAIAKSARWCVIQGMRQCDAGRYARADLSCKLIDSWKHDAHQYCQKALVIHDLLRGRLRVYVKKDEAAWPGISCCSRWRKASFGTDKRDQGVQDKPSSGGGQSKDGPNVRRVKNGVPLELRNGQLLHDIAFSPGSMCPRWLWFYCTTACSRWVARMHTFVFCTLHARYAVASAAAILLWLYLTARFICILAK